MEMPSCYLYPHNLACRGCMQRSRERHPLRAMVCVSPVALPWLTIDRLASGRDIRLSTATMRALDSRRPRPPSIFSSLLPRGFISLLLILLALDAARARGLPRELRIGDLIEPQSEGDSIDEFILHVRTRSVDDPEIKSDDDSKSEETRKKKDVVDGNDLETAGGKTEEKEGSPTEGTDEDGSVVKKRRRTDVVSSAKSGLEEAQEGEKIEEDPGEAKNEGIRRFDVRVDAEDRVSLGEKEVDTGDRRYRVTKDEETEIPDARISGAIEGTDGGDDREENVSSEVGDVGEEIPEDASAIRGYRFLGKSRGKSRYKSSTVYLNAEEKKIPVGEQESIVDGQIKKLISIRDDALGQKSVEKLDEAKVLISKEGIEPEEIVVEEDGRNDRSSAQKNLLDSERKEEPDTPSGRLRRIKNQALILQEQIRNRTFLQNLKEQATEILPEIPKFTEVQLLNVMRKIPPSKVLEPPSEYFSSNVTDPPLSEDQLQIIKCAELLVAPKQRQPFVTNVMECIRGLSVLNCMRIFVWPVVVENLPESINQNLGNLPIEVNLFDLFQGVRAKSARSHEFREIHLLAPETVVFGILREALTSRRVDESSPTFVDPKNETLKKLLTEGQVEILRMAERLLPEAARREFSDRMFSCVRRFEYYSCVKYFAWPMVRNYYPTLPTFPEYQAWYPTVAFFPEYPILPFPGFSEDTGELPEVVEADATRTKKPKPEAAIAEMFRNSFKDQETPSYVTLVPVEQLTAIHPIEQLVPSSYAEFTKPASNCITQYNRVICYKYTYSPVRQSFPSLSDITGIFSGIQYPGWSDLFDYVPSLGSFPDLSTFWPGGTTTTTTPAPSTTTVSARFGGETSNSLNELEIKLLDILLKIAGPQETIPSKPPSDSSSTDESATYSPRQRQRDILRLAHNLVPPSERFDLVATSVVCYHYTSDFANCTKYYVWPVVQRYHPDLPEFPKFESENVQSAQNQVPQNLGEKAQERLVPDGLEDQSPKITSRAPLQSEGSSNKGPQSVPVITVTGTRFVPIFTEHPESVIFNILRSVQLASPSPSEGEKGALVDTQQFTDLLNPQQENIVTVTQTLLPQSARPNFVTRMVDCIRGSNFLTCSRDVLWPALVEYFPRLPNFPNFGIPPISSSGTVSSSSPQNLTEPSSSSDAPPLAETNVKTGQHGDARVTITDTRFFPILNELPETVILNILRAVELSTPNSPREAAPLRTENLPNLSEQQQNIVQAAENLLPFSVRPVFIERMAACVRNNNFLRCTRDVAWPMVTEYFPRLPNFPNFGGVQNSPRSKLDVFLDDPTLGTITQEIPPFENLNPENSLTKQAEEKLEEILATTLEQASKPRLDESYLNAEDPAVKSLLNEREINIVRLFESGLPEPDRAGFISKILECAKDQRFLSCAENIGWSSLKQSLPTIPSFPNFDNLFGQLPSLPQFPDFGQVPSLPGIGSFPFQDVLGIPQLPGGFPQFPPGIPQIPSTFPIFPPVQPPSRPHISGLPELRGNLQTRSAQGETPPHRPAVADLQEKKRLNEALPIPPVVDFRGGDIPESPGQPGGNFVNVTSEKIELPEVTSEEQLTKGVESKASESIEKGKTRKRRNVVDLFASYRNLEEDADESSLDGIPNITESELLRLLISLTKNKKSVELSSSEPKRYFVDTLNSTVRDTLTADQYEILKMVEDLTYQQSNRGFVQQVIRCIQGLSFIRCMGIFVWPIITNNLPSLIGLPSLPTLPSFGFFGRSTETEVQDFFGMNTVEFEKELLLRKESMEKFLLSCYKKLLEEKFQTNVGFLRINGYGNGELGISIAGHREGRGTKIKDNKNLPSILTIISDIMEEVLDQRPDNEKVKKDKDKKERSLGDPAESDIQFLKDTEEYADVKRSINDDQLIQMFLDKIKTNTSEVTESEGKQYVNREQAFNAFEGLFGTRLTDKLSSKRDTINANHDSDDQVKEVHIVPLELRQKNSDQPKVFPLKNQMSYVLEKESSREQEDQQREKRAKNFAAFSLDEFSNEYPPEVRAEVLESEIEENEIEKSRWKDARKEFVVNLPSLDEEIVPRKMTSSMIEFGKGFKTKVMQLMPGVGLVLSFLVQMALAHARAAASMAGMISNMALGSAMFTMIRQSLFGPSTEPKIKYVYDNDKMGPGISWPHDYSSQTHYRS